MQSSPVLYTPIGSKQDTGKVHVGSAIFTRLKSQAILTADSLLSEIRTHRKAALFAGTSSVLFLLLFLPSVARWVNGIVNPVSPVEQPTTNISARTMKPLTNAGTSVISTVSFDGKWMAHVEEENGKQRLAVTNLENFASSIAVPRDDVQYLGVTFSRDNNYLYFTRKEKHGPGILYRLAWPGTNPVKVKTEVDSPISFSPQGDRFAYVHHIESTNEFLLMLANIDGSNEEVLGSRRDGNRLSIYGPAWSPDGSSVVCPASYWDKGFHTHLVGFDVESGREQLIGGQSWFLIAEVIWQDMTNLVMSARERETAPRHLWRIRASDGAAQKITYDPEDYEGVSIAGGNIVTVRTKLSWRIWVQTLDDSQKLTEITSGNGRNYGLAWTNTGRIVYSSMTQDRLNISRIDPDGTNGVQLTALADNYLPASSVDGRFIVFTSNRNGPFNIWRINADDGSDPTQLTFSDGNFYPSCSPDNQWVAYDNVARTDVSVWKVPINGGDPIKVGEKYRMPVFSPDSQFIACRYNRESGTRGVAIFSAQGGQPLRHIEEVPTQDWQRVQYFPNGRELSYIQNVDGYSNIWSYNLDTRTSKRLTNFNSDLIYAYAWSPDYKQIACQRGRHIRDVTMISEQ
jgi:Tol biopolymer transport system component